eukprot:scaffold31151_cov17-Tisochrysis_lutea.AAC.2
MTAQCYSTSVHVSSSSPNARVCPTLWLCRMTVLASDRALYISHLSPQNLRVSFLPCPVALQNGHAKLLEHVTRFGEPQLLRFLVLYCCLALQDGRAKLLEHNVRFGDPECQTLMARTQGDFTEALLQVGWWSRKAPALENGGPPAGKVTSLLLLEFGEREWGHCSRWLVE